MAGYNTWLVRQVVILLVCCLQLHARRNKHRSSGSDPNGQPTEDAVSPPEWGRRMTFEPTIIHAPGDMIILSCPGTGLPKPEIIWFRNGVSIRRDPDTKKIILPAGERMRMKNYNLKILDSRPHQSGNYTCIVRNDFGQLNWTFRVIIEEPVSDAGPGMPVLIDPPVNQTVQAGNPARFSCKAHVEPEYQSMLHVEWLQHYTVNGSAKDPEGIPYAHIILERTGRYELPDWDVLVIVNTQENDSAWYTCIVDVRGHPQAINHATFYMHVKPRVNPEGKSSSISSSTPSTASSPPPPTARPTDEQYFRFSSTTTESDRKRKKHRKSKNRGRKRGGGGRATEVPTTSAPGSTAELYTDIGEDGDVDLDVEGGSTDFANIEEEFSLEDSHQQETREKGEENVDIKNSPEVGSSMDNSVNTASSATVIQVKTSSTLVLIGVCTLLAAFHRHVLVSGHLDS